MVKKVLRNRETMHNHSNSSDNPFLDADIVEQVLQALDAKMSGRLTSNKFTS